MSSSSIYFIIIVYLVSCDFVGVSWVKGNWTDFYAYDSNTDLSWNALTIMEKQFWLFVPYFVGCQLRTVALSKCIELEINITFILTNNSEFQRFCTSIAICEHLSPFDEVKLISMNHLVIRSFVTNTNCNAVIIERHTIQNELTSWLLRSCILKTVCWWMFPLFKCQTALQDTYQLKIFEKNPDECLFRT